MKNKTYAIFFGATLAICLTTQVQAFDLFASGVPPSKDTLNQGESVEFFDLNKLKGDDVAKVNELITEVDGKTKVNIDSCSNIIVHDVSNNNQTSDDKSYVISVSPPELDTLSGIKKSGLFGDYECFTNGTLNTKNRYRLVKERIKNIPHIEVGWTYGLMVVPFKRYVGGGALKGGGTVGAYLGYKNFFAEHSFSFTPVVAFGYGNQKYDALDPVTSTVKEYTGGMLSYAVGATWGVSFDRFRFGFLYGRDDRSSADPSSPSFKGRWWSAMFGIGL